MRKEAAVQPVKDDVKASEVVTPVVEKNAPATSAAVSSGAKKQVAAAVETTAAKPKVTKKIVAAAPAKKAVADKPAPAAPKTPAKVVKKAPVAAKEKATEAPSKAEKASKAKKPAPKKPKLVRDSFTIPESDYALFATLKQRALSAGIEVKKSEILRAAVVALANLDDAGLVKAIGLVERIKTGRPKK